MKQTAEEQQHNVFIVSGQNTDGGAVQVKYKRLYDKCNNLKMDKVPATHFVDLQESSMRLLWRLQLYCLELQLQLLSMAH